MTFEVFKKKKMRMSGRGPGITISKAGIFTLNGACMEAFLKEVGNIELLFDKAGKKIGFRPTKTAEAHHYTLRAMKGMGQISGTAFLQNYELMPSVTSFFPAKWDDEAKAVVICMEEGEPCGRK